MRPARFSLYDVLGVASSASARDIKKAFHALAQKHHPDKNDNSPESTVLFQTIQNDYTVLENPGSRLAYDAWLTAEAPTQAAARRRWSPDVRGGPELVDRLLRYGDAVSLVLNHLNAILWEIEDLLGLADAAAPRRYDRPLRDYLLMMLTFIDEWVLNAAGSPDYFFRARGIEPALLIGGTPAVPHANLPLTHRPYAGVLDYFYDIRKRADHLLDRIRLVDLLATIPGSTLRVIDGILEAHKYCIHCLGWLQRAETEPTGPVPPFHHSDPAFDPRRR